MMNKEMEVILDLVEKINRTEQGLYDTQRENYRLKETIEHLTRENENLRSKIVRRQGQM